MKQYIGIDLGGTGIKGAVVREDGEILARQTCPTRPQRGPAAVVEDMAAMIRTLGRGREVAGVGLGCPGTVDDQAGTVVYACNIGWVNYDVRRALEDTGFSVRLVNDANAAALAEAAVGAAKGARSAVVVTLGTGIGGGVVLDGHLLTGFTGAASELGHMCIVADGESCACGRRGCWETYASATALIRRTEAAMAAHPDSALHRIAREKGGVDGRTAFAGQEAGDPAATRVVAEYIRYLGVGDRQPGEYLFPRGHSPGRRHRQPGGDAAAAPARPGAEPGIRLRLYEKAPPHRDLHPGQQRRCHRRGPLCRGKAGIMPQAATPAGEPTGKMPKIKKPPGACRNRYAPGGFFWFLFK